MGQSFYGPRSEWREAFLEEAFLLQRHLGMSYSDVRSLPIPYRRWFIDRLVEDFKKKKKLSENRSTSRSVSRDVPMGEIGPKRFG